MAVVNKKVSASSARAHTRKSPQKSSSNLPGVFKSIALILLVGFLAWAYQAIQPPPPKICGSPGGPPVTAPRIKLRDGRYLAYKEHGVPKENANYRVVYVHGFGNCRHDFPHLPREFAEEHGIYVVSFDRPGYGESDPDPKRTVKSIPLDIEELADQLGLGEKVYVMGFSMGGQVIWACLKHIPHRLLGATLLTPVVNHWWSGFPANLTEQVYSELLVQDQWALRVSHHLPWLTYWWNTQKYFPSSAVASGNMKIFTKPDLAFLSKMSGVERPYEAQITQQGLYETHHLDMIIGFGKWEFSPLDLKNPFPNNEGSVHLWQGDTDGLVPVATQRHIVKNLPWIKYHELPNTGHMFPHAEDMLERFLRAMLLKEQ